MYKCNDVCLAHALYGWERVKESEERKERMITMMFILDGWWSSVIPISGGFFRESYNIIYLWIYLIYTLSKDCKEGEREWFTHSSATLIYTQIIYYFNIHTCMGIKKKPTLRCLRTPPFVRRLFLFRGYFLPSFFHYNFGFFGHDFTRIFSLMCKIHMYTFRRTLLGEAFHCYTSL